MGGGEGIAEIAVIAGIGKPKAHRRGRRCHTIHLLPYANLGVYCSNTRQSLPIHAKTARGWGPAGMLWDDPPETYANLG
jgi:hypothetical protein